MRRFAIVIVVNLLVLELLSFAAVHALAWVRPDLRLDLMVHSQFSSVTESYHRTYLEKGFDRDLGWDNRPLDRRTLQATQGAPWTASYDAAGAREDSTDWPRDTVATYGDSFTHCDEVENEETWQVYLEALLGQDVLNFGVGAYGADQAVLKFARHVAAGRVLPVTVLAIHEVDLNRAATGFRPFYNRFSGLRLTFKPSYRPVGTGVERMPNPWTDPSWSLERLEIIAREMAETDYWVCHRLYVRPRFPHLLELLRALAFEGRQYCCRVQGIDCSGNLWDRPEGHRVMAAIVADFVATATAAGTHPVLLLIPPVNKWREGREPPRYTAFRDTVLGTRFPTLTVVDLFDAPFDEARFNVVPFAGHASPYGNSVIARELAVAIRPLVEVTGDR
ncbi:MAG: hypothetical protein PVF43_03335 [Candidatus Eiseniibacteriota bacterium]|jgi:hypothetical protein